MADSKSLSQKRYARYADGYVTSQTHAKGADLPRLVGMAAPQSDWLALDIATGGGHTALAFAPRVSTVIATDLTPAMLIKARAHILGQGAENVIFCPADAENLPFTSDTFDLVTCRIAPHHFPDCARFVSEAARVMRQDGMVIVQDHVLPDDRSAAQFIDDFERLRDPSHHRAFSAAEWLGMFERAGLGVVETHEAVKRHDLIAWAERQGADADLIARLRNSLAVAPTTASKWLEPLDLEGARPSFVNRHILICGRKLEAI